ncbi:hypothetical protein JY97_17515 [Alkalispirochaeta odontotermitis]|nr:hypothetical protein JY97_17515 [Alkalispirochaeta odontotermitis]
MDRLLDDDEFCFDGAASAEILAHWKARLGLMMPHFIERFGDDARDFDSAFLECLAAGNHRSRSRVWLNLARKPAAELKRVD